MTGRRLPGRALKCERRLRVSLLTDGVAGQVQPRSAQWEQMRSRGGPGPSQAWSCCFSPEPHSPPLSNGVESFAISQGGDN